jgi:uncharacterized membrane protein
VSNAPLFERRKTYQVRAEDAEGETVVTARLGRPAKQCYRLFCDAERLREWLIAVDRVEVLRRDREARAREVEFHATLKHVDISYTLSYKYDDERLRVQWTSGTGSIIKVAGSSRFTEIDDEACWMRYRLISERAHYLPEWDDLRYEHNPAETVVIDFCDWVTQS